MQWGVVLRQVQMISEYTGAKNLDRREWLKGYGFKQDPFCAEALRAEDDELLYPEKGATTEAFVEFPYYQEIRGTPGSPGPCFIFACRGGGKTALRLRIQRDFDNALKQGQPEKVLAVVYTIMTSIYCCSRPATTLPRSRLATTSSRLLG
jgi:hypothetical protein